MSNPSSTNKSQFTKLTGSHPQTDWVKHIASTSYDVMWDLDINSGEIYIGESVLQVLGFSLPENKTQFDDCLGRIPELERLRVREKLNKVLASTQLIWNDQFTLTKNDGDEATAIARASIIRDDNGQAIRLIGALQDVTKMRELERQLAIQAKLEKVNSEKQLDIETMLSDEISSKEMQIASAVVDAEELQRSELGRELHDNVNQLLGASRLYLNMARSEEGDIALYLQRSEEYTIMAIEAIRDMSKGLTSDTIINFGLLEAIDKLVTDTMETLPIAITFTVDQNAEQRLNMKFKLNLFRIIQEQVNNIVKYAECRNVSIQLSQNRFAIILSITDDGQGFSLKEVKGGIGLSNIGKRAALFNGVVKLESLPGEGCSLKVIFPSHQILFVPVPGS